MRNCLKIIFFLTSYAIASQMAVAQECYIPKNYVFEEKNDYQAHAGTVEKCLRWLLETPLHEEVEKRAEANAFVMQWLAGSPEVIVETSSDLMPFADKNEELFYTFIHALALYQMEHETIEKDGDTVFALEEVVKMHRQSKGLKKDPAIKELKRAKRWGNLQEWIAERSE